MLAPGFNHYCLLEDMFGRTDVLENARLSHIECRLDLETLENIQTNIQQGSLTLELIPACRPVRPPKRWITRKEKLSNIYIYINIEYINFVDINLRLEPDSFPKKIISQTMEVGRNELTFNPGKNGHIFELEFDHNEWIRCYYECGYVSRITNQSILSW